MAHNIEILDEGAVTARQANTPTAVAVGPRLAVLSEKEILCSYMLQTRVGSNDFKPALARSRDGGRTWGEETLLFPELTGAYSFFVALSRNAAGELFLFGTRTPIDAPDESFWSEANQGMKQNELIWSRSGDGGRTWRDWAVIPTPIAGSAEAPGAMCAARDGKLLACYSPYNTFDPAVKVDRNHLALLSSEDQGRSWQYRPIMRFANENAGLAEAWVVELADGRLAAACWQFDHVTGQSSGDQYALSDDGGRTWAGPFYTGIQGQSVGLAGLPDGRLAMVYNQREAADPGVYLAVARPQGKDFGVEVNGPLWRAAATNQTDGQTSFEDWTDYAFGEPATAVLPSGEMLAVLWCLQPGFRGVRWVRFRLN